MSLDDRQKRLASALDRGSSVAILCGTAYWLAVSGREVYRGPVPLADVALERLKTLNEIQIILTSQLKSEMEGGPAAYPTEALVAALFERAVMGDCVSSLTWAVERAVSATADEGPPS